MQNGIDPYYSLLDIVGNYWEYVFVVAVMSCGSGGFVELLTIAQVFSIKIGHFVL